MVTEAPFWRRLLAELLGSAFLAAIVIGSGIAAQQLSPGDVGLQLFENAAATAAGLFAIILMFGPVSGAHFNPVVSFVDAAFGGLRWRDAAAYLPAQVAGCIGGAVLANLMFSKAAICISTKHRATGPHFLSEVIATLGPAPGHLRPGPHRPGPTRAGRGRRLHRGGLLLHQLDQLRQPGHHRRADVLRHLRRHRPVLGPESSSPPRSSVGCWRSLSSRRSIPDVTPAEAADIVVPHHGSVRRRRHRTERHSNRQAADGRRRRLRPARHRHPHQWPTRTDRHAHHCHRRSDAGISAALRARELDPAAEVTVVVADAYPNFSICGIPYYVSGEVTHWRNLAHRTIADLEATGMELRLDTVARRIDRRPQARWSTGAGGRRRAPGLRRAGRRHRGRPGSPAHRGAARTRRPRAGRRRPPAALDGRHLRRDAHPEDTPARSAVIVGAGYIGLEMAEALVARGLSVTQIEQLPEVLPTVDPELGAPGARPAHRARRRRADRHRGETDRRGRDRGPGSTAVEATAPTVRYAGTPTWCWSSSASVPTPSWRRRPVPTSGPRRRIDVDRQMRTNLPDVFAAGDCAVTHHRLLGTTYLPLGTTAHKQGRVAGENALGGHREFAGSLGTQVVKVFDMAAARTGLRDHEAVAAGFDPVTVGSEADDHKAYYPGSHRIAMRYTGDRRPAGCSGSSSSATATPRWPSGSTSPPPPSSTR